MRRSIIEVQRWVREGIAEITYEAGSTIEVRWTRTNKRQMIWVV